MSPSFKASLGGWIHKQKLFWRRAAWRWRGLRRLRPFSSKFGLEFGKPVDRYYIESFLTESSNHIRGRVLELGEATYTRRFGGARVEQSDVLHAVPGNPAATLVGDLATGQGIPTADYDCIVLTQALSFIPDSRAVIRNCFHALKPGGALLLTTGGISQISRYDAERWGDYWRFTDQGLRSLLEQHFPAESITIRIYGNVLAAAAQLYGINAEALRRSELDFHDPDYEVTVAAVAIKPR